MIAVHAKSFLPPQPPRHPAIAICGRFTARHYDLLVVLPIHPAAPRQFPVVQARPADQESRRHRLQVFYHAYRNVQLGFTGLFGRPLVTASNPKEDSLTRLQFDVTYKL
jgi:hypothetical protein